MIFYDPLIHPALIDPRQWADVNLYDLVPPVEREAVQGTVHHRPDRQFAAEHLRLELAFDFEKESVTGSAQFRFRAIRDDLDHIVLDAAELSISSISEGGGELKFFTQAEMLLIEFARPLNGGDVCTIEIMYSARPRKGLFFIKPDATYPGKPRQIWSQGENADAHWWFPCPDVTNQKMTTELIGTFADDFTAISNGVLVATEANAKEKTKTWHWRLEQPHPAYLLSIVAGQYERIEEKHDSLPVEYYVYPSRIEQGRRLFANTPQMIELFESRFGVAYPYPKYSQVLVDDFLFGAMENTSATTMTDRVLLDERAAIDINYDDIVAHDQWWGDLVTCKDWSEIWLNESFATYSEYLWRESSRGTDEARFALLQDMLVYLGEDRRSRRRPIVSRKYRYSEELMDRHAYEKGGFVLSMLRAQLGDDAFFKSLSHYLKKHAHGVAETSDFRIAIEEVTGRNLSRFFEQWIHGAGVPELDVECKWDRDQRAVTLLVKQVQSLDDGTPLFYLPVDIEITTSDVDGTRVSETHRVVVEKAEQEFHFVCDTRPELVAFDKGHTTLKVMRFGKSSQELAFQMKFDDDVLGRLRAARELAAFKSADVMRDLVTTLTGTDFWAVRMAAALSLGELGSEEARDALLTHLADSDDARVRRGIAVALGNFKTAEVTRALEKAIESDASYFVAVGAVRALANIGSDEAYGILSRALAHHSWQEVIRAAIFHGFSHAKEKRAAELAIENSRYGEHQSVRVAAIGCLGVLGRELRTAAAGDAIVDHLINLLNDKSIHARAAAIRAIGRIGNGRALGPLREATQRECLDQMKAALEDSIAALEKASKKS
jgi:aminopeptidase N